MSVGGLLKEIKTQPRPKEAASTNANGTARAIKLGGILLAAGQSSRMDGTHKLRALFNGVPLICCSLAVLSDALEEKPIVVLGSEGDELARLLPPESNYVMNLDFAKGLSGSLRTGIATISDECDGALIHLADMPAITSAHIKALAKAFVALGGKSVVRATHFGKPGNPVILPRSLFGQVMRLTGDMGARSLIENFTGQVIDVEMGQAASFDVDTPEALVAAGGTFAQ